MNLEMQPTTPGGAAAGEEWGPWALPNLLGDESEDEYEAMLAEMRALVKPADLIEEFWVRDVVDLIWETQRLRRLKTEMMKSAAQNALVRALRAVIVSDVAPGQDARHLPGEIELAAGFAAGEAQAVERTQKLLGRNCQTARAIEMRAVADRMDDIDRFNRMIAAADRQRMCILREIERHRATFGKSLRQAAERLGGGAACGAQAPVPATKLTAAVPAGPTSPDIGPSREAEPARLCKSSKQSQAGEGRSDPAPPSQPATPPVLQNDRTNPFGLAAGSRRLAPVHTDQMKRDSEVCTSNTLGGAYPLPLRPANGRRETVASEASRVRGEHTEEPLTRPRSARAPSPARGEGEEAGIIDKTAVRNKSHTKTRWQPRPAVPFRPAARIEENPARMPTDGPTEPVAPPPGTPEWDEYYRWSMGQPLGHRNGWWPKSPVRTDREIEEERLRSAGQTDSEMRIHSALDHRPSWIRGPPDR
jgi:hypothetical protein